MNWFHNGCRPYRKDISLLAAEVLPHEREGDVQAHLAHCPECNLYFKSVAQISNELHHAHKNTAAVQPRAVFQVRWRRAIRETPRPDRWFLSTASMLPRWESLSMFNRASIALGAAAWAAILFLNLSTPEIAETAQTAKVNPTELRMALQASQRVFSERQNTSEDAPRNKTPASRPGPRSKTQPRHMFALS